MGQLEQEGGRLRPVFRKLFQADSETWTVVRGGGSRRGKEWGEGRGESSGGREKC